MRRRGWWLIVVAVLILGGLLVLAGVLPVAPRGLTGTFRLENKAKSVPAHVLERDFRKRLTHFLFRPKSVSCRSDLPANLGATAQCESVFPGSWKSGTPQAMRNSSGWLSDRAHYAVTRVDGRAVEFAITPRLGAAMLENALSQDLGTATFLQCPTEGIAGVAGTTLDCKANYGYPDGPCSDPLFDEQGRASPVLRRCTLLVGVQKVSGLYLDVKILRVTPPA